MLPLTETTISRPAKGVKRNFALDKKFLFFYSVHMDKHIRFHIDLEPDDAKILDKLAVHLSKQKEAIVTRASATRIAIRAMAKQERIR